MALHPKHFGTRGALDLATIIRERESVAEPAVRIAVDRIVPSTRNPRSGLPAIVELADSIEAYGLLQPVVVRENGAGYELIAGHRRLAAVQLLRKRSPQDPRWEEIPAVLRRQADDREAYLLTLTENLQREDLTPREEAAALELLVTEFRMTTVDVAGAIKRSQPYVSKRLRVYADEALGPAVLMGRVPVTTAEELLPLKDRRQRDQLLERAIAERWDAPTARAAVREVFDSNTSDRYRRAEADLLQHLRAVRSLIREVSLDEFTAETREELHRCFLDLAAVARPSPATGLASHVRAASQPPNK
jgi:ParB family transcriptional regulator, chromosome partitioning protein